MEQRPGRTETLGSTTVVTMISADDPALRPGRPSSVRATVCRFHGTDVERDVESIEVTFGYGLHWDVARIDSRLGLRYAVQGGVDVGMAQRPALRRIV